MLDYTITVLQKVSFDVHLFVKEVKKAVRRLLPSEIVELKIWLVRYVHERPELHPSLVYVKS